MENNILRKHIQDDIKDAMRSKDSKRLSVLRMLTAAIKQREIDERINLDEVQILSVIDKMIRQRREAQEQFKNAGRIDLAEKEQYEILVLQHYLPEPLSNDEIEKIIADAITQSKAQSIKDLGKVIAIIKPKVQGRADIGQISAKIKSMLTA